MEESMPTVMEDQPPGRPGRMVLWYGQLTTRRRLLGRGWLMIGAPAAWLSVFLVMPVLFLAVVAFARRDELGQVRFDFGLHNVWSLLGFTSFGWSAAMLRVLGMSLFMAAGTTVLSLLLGYPLAFFIAARRSGMRYLLLALVMIPFCTNMVIRTYGWQLLFMNQLPLAKLAAWAGLVGEGESLYPSWGAIFVGMVSGFLPFAVLPIYTNVERLDWSIVEAAQDLYASRWRLFVHAIVPQTLPGLSAAVILTFIPAMGTFVVSDVLGMRKFMLIGNKIEQSFMSARDIPSGAMISLVLMLLTLVVLMIFRRHWARSEVGG